MILKFRRGFSTMHEKLEMYKMYIHLSKHNSSVCKEYKKIFLLHKSDLRLHKY